MWQPDPLRQRLANHTVEDLLTYQDDAHYELVDGVLHVIPFHTAGHQDIVGSLTAWLRDRTPDHFRVTHQLSVAFAIDSTREADVFVHRADHPGDHAFLRPHEVELAVNVVAPTSRRTDRIVKPAEFAAAGIRHYWRVEPEPVHVYADELGDDGHYGLVADSADLLELERPFPIKLPVTEITP